MRAIGFGLMCAVGIWAAAASPGCDPEGLSDDCGVFGETYCQEIVECCDFATLDDPAGEAAGQCILDRDLADELAQGEDPNHDDCLEMMDNPAYQEACFSCPQDGSEG